MDGRPRFHGISFAPSFDGPRIEEPRTLLLRAASTVPELPGIPRLTFATGERFTPIGALKAIGISRKEEVTYALLMGVSGAAFRATWSPDWALDMAEFTPEDVVQHGAEWLGLTAEPRLNDPLEEAWIRVSQSIDHGMPVLSCGLAGAPEFCVIAGYEESPRQLRVRGYFERGEGRGYAAVEAKPWQGWNHAGFGRNPIVVLGARPPPDRGKVLRASLLRALRFAKLGRVTARGRTHFVGHAAYDAWRESLANLDTSGDLGLKAWAMATNLSAIADARRAAGEFLRIVAAMKAEWSRALNRAAEHYFHYVAVLAQAQPIVEFPREAPALAAEKAAANLADPQKRALLAKFLWTAKQEDEEALGWIDIALHGVE